MTPENGDTLRREDQPTIYPSGRDGRQEGMSVDTRPEKEIKEEGNQVQLGKQRQETPSTVATSPDNHYSR